MKYICKLCIITKCIPTYVDEHKPSNLIKEGNWAIETPECNPTKSFYTAGFHPWQSQGHNQSRKSTLMSPSENQKSESQRES